jgi:hypothetical protein
MIDAQFNLIKTIMPTAYEKYQKAPEEEKQEVRKALASKIDSIPHLKEILTDLLSETTKFGGRPRSKSKTKKTKPRSKSKKH